MVRPFDPGDPTTWGATLTVDELSAIAKRSVMAIRKACQQHRFQPAPFEKHPYRWRRIDCERHYFPARGLTLTKKASGY